MDGPMDGPMDGYSVEREQVQGAQVNGDIPEETVEELKNPFLTREEREMLRGRTSLLTAENLSVTAIFSHKNLSKAIINGRILKVGDKIDAKEIVRIEPEQVILKDLQNEFVAKIGELR